VIYYCKRRRCNINQRIKELRKALNMTRDDFGKALGVSRDVIANIELDRLARPGQKEPLIMLMCELFNVNREWLTTGQGEMFIDNSDDQNILNAYCHKYNITGDARKIIELYARFTPEQRSMIVEVIKMIAEGLEISNRLIPDNPIRYAARTVTGEPVTIEHIPDLSQIPDEGEEI
jgi:DNA-binding XRE family transcriptional regulator